MPCADLADVRMYYELGGSGPPLLIVNGTGSDLRQHPNPTAWPVAEHLTVLAYDHRGLGQSEPADPDHRPTMADFAEDALALADHVGWPTFRVLGVSFGGMVAQEIALAAGDRVERMVLACTSPGGAGGASYPLHDLYELEADERNERLVAITDLRSADDPELRDLIMAFVGRNDREGGSTDAAPPLGLQRQLAARRAHDTYERLASMAVPTLVAAGRYDGIAPLANSEALAAQIPGAELAVFEGGHAFMMQDLSCWAVMTDFLLA
ncbi:MAG: alpha/beta hydrolase [Actinomycetota bacterium]|nr:alpha/beta hydrolase [Actinomycetota bacterium]